MTVVEVALGVSELGLGMAGGVPGMILADLGAQVTRVIDPSPLGIDAHVAWGRAWHRRKQSRATADPTEVRDLLLGADVALVYGPESMVEERGLGALDVREANETLVYVRCRPSRTAAGTVEDFGLLVEARSGFCTQLAGHRPGPIFDDVKAPAVGTALLMAAAALALLGERARTGHGGVAETSLYDGMLAALGVMIGRSERAAPEVESYWAVGSTFPNFLYRCADGELIQVWFGGKGMFAALLDVLGDEPSTAGYYAEQVSGLLNARAVRWAAVFARQDRAVWVERLRAAGIPCEPVLAPGDALSDPHVIFAGLSVADGDDLVAASPISVTPLDPGVAAASSESTAGDRRRAPRAPLEGVRVLDFSAFVAGPLGAQVLADLGAEVIKVEPLAGEAMRAAGYAVAACQRGKRSLAIDLHAPGARPVVDRLVRWADVVLHNWRVGVAERLGLDDASIAALNPTAVYCHASAFGSHGPRATAPSNDALMQALTGLERAVGGPGNDPIAPTWIPIDVTGGWVAAIGMLAGLYARSVTGRGQRVSTSLLGAGLLMQSGSFKRAGERVEQPALDAAQTGYGPGYRIYRGADETWFALVLPDEESWHRLRAVPEAGDLAPEYVPLRRGTADTTAEQAEAVLGRAFASAPAADWVGRLRRLGILAELIETADRDRFRRGVLDDPVNRQLGRVVSYETADWGRFEQVGRLLRMGPGSDRPETLALPGIGEHTVEVLAEMSFGADEIDALLAAGIARQLGSQTRPIPSNLL